MAHACSVGAPAWSDHRNASSSVAVSLPSQFTLMPLPIYNSISAAGVII